MNEKRKVLLTTALAGLVATGFALSTASSTFAGDSGTTPPAEGKNSCGGNGSCSGKNDCKGKGASAKAKGKTKGKGKKKGHNKSST